MGYRTIFIKTDWRGEKEIKINGGKQDIEIKKGKSDINCDINYTLYKHTHTHIFILGGSKFTADGGCSHEIKRRLLLGR